MAKPPTEPRALSLFDPVCDLVAIPGTSREQVIRVRLGWKTIDCGGPEEQHTVCDPPKELWPHLGDVFRKAQEAVFGVSLGMNVVVFCNTAGSPSLGKSTVFKNAILESCTDAELQNGRAPIRFFLDDRHYKRLEHPMMYIRDGVSRCIHPMAIVLETNLSADVVRARAPAYWKVIEFPPTPAELLAEMYAPSWYKAK